MLEMLVHILLRREFSYEGKRPTFPPRILPLL
jgi:hypothetical protein